MARSIAIFLVGLAACGPAAASGRAAGPDPVRAALAAAQAAGAIDQLHAQAYGATYGSAMGALPGLDGVRRRELRAAVHIVRDIARRGALTAERMPLAFLTLQRNVEWWTAHGPPAAGSPGEKDAQGRRCKPLRRLRARAARVSFPGSGLVWEYYRGLGLQLHINGTFAAATSLLQTKLPEAMARAAQILDEMRPLASHRGGALTWEYFFPFGGGRPPWGSGLSQATAIEAYLAAAILLGRPDYLQTARDLAGLFALRPPAGVNVRLARDGSWFALYTFAPGAHVLNAQLNAVTALHDLAAATHDPLASTLFRGGLRAARRHIARFDTGRWSLYAEHGPLADLNYHVLNRDLARSLCQRTGERAICKAWHSFTAELERRCPRVSGSGRIAARPAGQPHGSLRR
jgi:D-glucuronyl C5-epimerase C-terminus